MKIIKESPANKSDFLLAPRHPENGAEFSVNLLRLLNDGASDFYTELVPIGEISAIEKRIPEFYHVSMKPVIINEGDGSTAHAVFYFERRKLKKSKLGHYLK